MHIVTHNPHGFAITDDEFAALLRTIDRLARTYTSETASFDECRDHGRDALLTSWQSWQGAVPFTAFARVCVRRRMKGAAREYHRWAFPCALSVPPDAETRGWMRVRETAEDDTSGTWEVACEPPESTTWFMLALERHRSCMSPTTHQALQDTLAEQSHAEITARDGVTGQTVTTRYNTLVSFLARHVVHRETSCREEEEKWKPSYHHPIILPEVKAARKQARDRAYRLRRKMAGAALACAD